LTHCIRPALALLIAALLAIRLVELAGAAQQQTHVQFVNIASEAKVAFKHENGATPQKYMPETMAGGSIILDYNNDGWPDIFFVNGGSFVDKQKAAGARHRLYRNNKDGTFTDVTATSGIGVSGFGMGACSADYDNDGWPDLYITSVGGNKLYHNNGNGAFTDVTDKAGVGSQLWSASCAFGDIDNDGYVDLYVTNYVDFSVQNNKYCVYTGDTRVYCHPNVYNGVPDILYRNNGDGTFTDVSKAAGIYRPDGKGLGVVFGDYDGDGWIDIYVANDSTPNFLFHNKGKGVFEEVGLLAGVAVGSDGQALAGMGTDMGDVDGDGLLDIFVTNLDRQTHNLYRNLGKGLFADVTFESGVGEATLPFVGFGAVFFDYDNDTDLDLAIANGDVIDNVSLFRDSTSYEQRNLLLQNDGMGKFRDVGPASGPGFALKKPSRSLSTADIDNDGDLDLLIGNVGQTADLLRNDGGNNNNSLSIRTVGSKSNRDGIGARLRLTVGGKVLLQEVKAGSSYLSQNDLRVHFGMGKAPRAERLEIRWPSGAIEVLQDVEANQILTVTEGRGVTSRTPMRR
jgi:enediyne biosynthesis protein E4